MVNNENILIDSDYEDTFNLFSKNNISLDDYIDIIEVQDKKIKLLEDNQKNMEIFLGTLDNFFTHLIDNGIGDESVKNEILSRKEELNNLISIDNRVDLEEIDSFIQNKMQDIDDEDVNNVATGLLNELRMCKNKIKDLSEENKALNNDLINISNKTSVVYETDVTVQLQTQKEILNKLNNFDNEGYNQIIKLLQNNIDKQNMYNDLITSNSSLIEIRTNLLRSDILQYFNTYNNNLNKALNSNKKMFDEIKYYSHNLDNTLSNLENRSKEFNDIFETKLNSLSVNLVGVFNSKIDSNMNNLAKLMDNNMDLSGNILNQLNNNENSIKSLIDKIDYYNNVMKIENNNHYNTLDNATKVIDKKSTDHFNLLINSIHNNTASIHEIDNNNYNKLNKAIEDNRVLSEFYYNQQNSRSFKEKFMSKFPRLAILFRFKKFGFKNTLKTIRGYSKIKKERLFDVKYYICNNKYLSTMSGDPLLNYLLHEENWVKYPNNNFDPVFFRSQHKDMPEKLNALVYYSLYHNNFNWPTKK